LYEDGHFSAHTNGFRDLAVFPSWNVFWV